MIQCFAFKSRNQNGKIKIAVFASQTLLDTLAEGDPTVLILAF